MPRRPQLTRGTLGAVSACSLAVVLASLTGASPTALAAPTDAAEEPGELRIHDIQGTTRTSPYVGERVEGVPGVVTAVNRFGSARGFWFQDTEGDGDARTSEGLFVFTGESTPDTEPGDEVLVSGQVGEYRPGGTDSGNQTVTQLDSASWTVRSTGNPLPEAETLKPNTIPEAYAAAEGDLSHRDLEPDTYALDFLESREHMRVAVSDARVVGPTDDFDALWITTKPEQNPTGRGGTVYNSYDEPNSGRLKVESLIPFDERPFPEADVRDELQGVTEGPLGYSEFGGYLINATALGEHVSGGLERETGQETPREELSLATYNVENLSAADEQATFDRLAEGIADHLRGPDIVSLEEIQANSGPEDDGTVDADETLDRLVDAVAAAGGPDYEWRQINPRDNADGGQPGGNIRNAFLFNPERVDFTDIPGGDATTPVEVRTDDTGRPELSASPGRVAPGDNAWLDSRKPLAGQFEFEGRRVIVVTNHFGSKHGDDPLHGAHQPPERSSEEQRNRQAGLVRDFVDEVTAIDPQANVAVVGDLNDFEFSETLRVLTADGGLYNPMTELPADQRYTYVFDGNSQALDHILTGRGVAHRVDYEVVRLNSEFHDQASDHDPLLARFRPLSGDADTDAAEDTEFYNGAEPRDDAELEALVPALPDQYNAAASAPGPGPVGIAAAALAGLGAAALLWRQRARRRKY